MDQRNALDALPEFLQVTDEQIQISRQIQERAKQALYGRVQASQEEARLARGIQLEKAVRERLEALGTHGRLKGKADLIRRQFARLADAYADQGRYGEAASVHPDRNKVRELQLIHYAVTRPDDEQCHCPAEKEVQDPATGKTLRIPQQIKVDDVYSVKHGRMMPLVRCELCGDLNVKPLNQVLARREAMSAEAKTNPVRDVDALK